MAKTHAVILCRPTDQPAGFLAHFVSTAPIMEVTASGRVTENMFTSAGGNYDDEPAIVYEMSIGTSATIVLPQELQSTGDDVFTALMQSPIQAAPGTDTHRLESVELLLRRGTSVHPGSAVISVAPVTSNVLDTQGGTIGTGIEIPGLNNASIPVKGVTGMTATGRFVGFQAGGVNTKSAFQYLGAILRGRRVV